METRKTLMYLSSIIIYGTIGYFLHFINCASEFVVMCRGLIGSIFIFILMFIRNDLPDIRSIKANLKMLIISGASLGLNWLFLFAGYRYVVSITSLLNYTAPIIVVIILTFISKQKLTVKQIICIGVAFVGITLVSGLFDGGNNFDIHCFIYGFLAAIAFVILVLCNRKIENIKPLDKTIVQLFMSFLTVLPVVILKGDIPTILDTNSIILLVMMGVVHTGIAYILYFNSIDTLNPSKIAILGYIEPVLSVIIGVVIFKEELSLIGGIGAILILTAALASEIGKK